MSRPLDRVTVATEATPTWALRRAVLVYQQDHIQIGERENARVYATVHDVESGKGGLQLGAGVPATREACADLARALGANASLSGFVPESLLYLGARSLIWWRPPGPGRVFFDTTKDAAGDQADDKTGAGLIGKRNAVVPHPGLVLAVTGGHWFVYALKGTARPAPDQELFRAPYFNVWESGEICTGNVRLPDTLTPAALAVYERAFFDSEFTHPNMRGRGELVRWPGGPYAFWKAALDGAFNPPPPMGFPLNALVPARLTLKGLAKKLETTNR